MLKITGIMGLIISFGMLGVSKTNELKQRIKLLEDYFEMIMTLKGQINYFKEPLPEIFMKMGKNSNSKAYLFLEALGHEIEEKNCYTKDFWAKKLMFVYEDTSLTKKDIEIMSYLGEFVGQTDYTNQMQHFEYMEEKLKKQISDAKALFIQKGPMYNKIGFFVGAVVGILII